MIGMERNSDIVKMASFAPLFEHFDMAQWSVSDESLFGTYLVSTLVILILPLRLFVLA